MSNEVIILHNGYSIPTENGFKSNCTCSLIKGPQNIIVDTMTAWDGKLIVEALAKNEVKPCDINWVVCTHCHSDHVGCNYLFPEATHIVGNDVSKRDHYFDTDISNHDYIINEKVYVKATPGHTLQDVSVVVKSEKQGTVVITGDLFENENDLLDDSIWISVGSQNEELQRKNREAVLKIADWIVPGHGPMFKVSDVRKQIF